jgi:uncharacterized protein YaeQ
MALTSTLYRFRIELSDVDRSLYRTLDLRLAKHPSENEAYLLTRVIAYALSYEEGLELAPGLCADDEPALFVKDMGPAGGFRKWIEIGNPSARRLHKASKAASGVEIYTYKDPANLVRELKGERVHRLETIRAFAVDPGYLATLAARLSRDNTWALFRQDGELTVVMGEENFSSSLETVALV